MLKNGARFRYTRSRDYQTPTRDALLGSGSSWKTHLLSRHHVSCCSYAGFWVYGAGGGGAGSQAGADQGREARTQLHDGQPADETGQFCAKPMVW